MYYQYFGLEDAPFSIAVNPRYLFMSSRHRDALAHLLYGMGAGGGFILLTGEVGTGKTTINRCLLEQLPDHADIAIILNPALDARDLLETVCEELRIELEESQPGLKSLTGALHRFLLDNHSAGRKTVLMIDEAQHLGFDVLEQIRLLTNLETNEEKLLHIILIGQPELAEKLARPELRQLNQRITARFDLRPLSPGETGAYIRHRLSVAGLPAGQQLFDPALVRAIHRESRGIPRLINLLCDRMLLGAYGRDSSRLDRALLRQAAREVNGEYARDRSLPRLALPLLGLGAMALVALGLWWLLAPSGPTPSPVPDNPAQVLGGGAEIAALPPAEVSPGDAADDSVAMAAGSVPAVAAGQASTAGPETPPPTAYAWRLSVPEGTELLAALYDTDAEPSPCALPPLSDLRCEQVELRSWDQLQEEGRPALLEVVDARRFAGRVLFLGIQGDQAVVANAAGLTTVPLATLAQAWTGRLWRYWSVPPELTATLQRGSRGASVRSVAVLFARIDSRDQPLTEDLFDARLEQRVRLFQRERGLQPDGVLGARTLRALVLAAGVDLDFSAAQEQVALRSAAGRWP